MAEGGTSETNPGSAPSLVEVEVLDPRGDLTLVAGQQKKVNFLVCSRALARSSSFFEGMLYGGFKEGKNQQSDATRWTVELPEDSPDALRVCLRAVHCKFDIIPPSLSEEAIFDLVILCDKCDMVGLLKPFWDQWVTALPPASGSPMSFVRRLWIARTLGYVECYKMTLMKLMSLLRTDGKGGIFLDLYAEDLGKIIHFQQLGVASKWRSNASLNPN
jgi:hypothetical protein